MDNPFQAVQEAREQYEKAIQELGDQAVGKLFKDFFAEHPYILGIGWIQYTPYFNDGDECIFGVNDLMVQFEPLIAPIIAPNNYDEVPVYVDPDNLWQNFCEIWVLENSKVRKDLVNLNTVILTNDDVMKAIFGDHAKVIARPNEITVTFYEHD